jgi:hypothetical protein
MSRKTRISLFCAFNLSVIVWANVPERVSKSFHEHLPAAVSPEGVQCAQCGNWLIARYGHFTGLGTGWKLFAGLPRYHYWLTVEVLYPGGRTEERPRPVPEHRLSFLTPIFNHRENKYDLNLLGDLGARITLGRWLCRQIAAEGEAAETVQFIINRYDIVPRDQLTTFVGPPLHARQRMEQISCALLPGDEAGEGDAGGAGPGEVGPPRETSVSPVA